MEISELNTTAQAFSRRLKRLKEENASPEFTWYGYDILANAWHLDRLLTGSSRHVFSQIGGGRVADVGAADGDMAFLLESVGIRADIIDFGPYNWNGLRGARRLKELLDSAVGIHEIDLDSYFEMPRERYGMVMMMGILYHLRNPFYVLERFARHSEYLALSTRIARYTVDGTAMRGSPVAYLLAPDECNNDATNYWIFSEAGLKRILQRSGWEVLDFDTVGDTRNSNPADPDHDERAFVFARSAAGKPD